MFRRSHRLLEEEGETGGGSGGGYIYGLPGSLKTLDEWFQTATGSARGRPIYAVFLLDHSSQNAIEVIEKSRPTLAASSGLDICIVYFRNARSVESLAPWSIDEHIMYSVQVAALLGASIPSVIFFESFRLKERTSQPEVVELELDEKAPSVIVSELRDIFANYYSNSPSSNEPLERLRTARNMQMLKTMTISESKTVARTAAVEFIKGLGKAAVGLIVGS